MPDTDLANLTKTKLFYSSELRERTRKLVGFEHTVSHRFIVFKSGPLLGVIRGE